MKRFFGLTALLVALGLAFTGCSNSGALPTTPTGGATYYTITVVKCLNGTVTASATNAAERATVTLDISPASGYELDIISVAAGSNPIALNGTGNTRTFEMPAANVTVTAAFKALPVGFVKVEGATIIGGSKFSYDGSKKGVFVAKRTVTLSTFYMCDHEVTQAEYEAVVGSNPSSFDGSSGKEAAAGETQGDRPVEQVTWYGALVYCNKKSISEGLAPCYSIGGKTNPSDWGSAPKYDSDEPWDVICDMRANGYRLPTEAEWEYAALGGKAGVETAYPDRWAGGPTYERNLETYAWDSENSGGKTHAVKTKTKNGLGLFDMTGNVWEWCWDWYDADAKAGDNGNASVTDPLGAPSGSDRVMRGGDWSDSDINCVIPYRRSFYPYRYVNRIGFRVVRSAN